GDWNIWNSIFFAATGIVTGIYFLDAVRTPMSATTESPSEPLIALWRLKCPHCAAVYAYDEQEGTEPGFVRCQNCYREFGPTADKQTSQASPEEDVQ
ncbi:MAG: MJ0042-type zinc finger domain-containing protein, partial [Candidatus Thorarchaeota archaeon]